MARLILVALVVLAVGCSSNECADCGDCGLRGPASRDALVVDTFLSADDLVVVWVSAENEEECGATRVSIEFDGSGLKLAEIDAGDGVERGMVQDDRYTFGGDPRAVAVAQSEDLLSAELTFFSNETLVAQASCEHSSSGPVCDLP